MAKYKIRFPNQRKNYKVTKNVGTKAEIASIAQNFDKNKIEYEAQEYSKKEGRYGWRVFVPSNFCQICGRTLTDPESIQRGIGPICAGKHRIPKDSNPSEDPYTKILNGLIAQKVIEIIPEYKRNTCQFCEGDLSHRVYYYEHEGGWYVESLGMKVWIWIECSKCGHQWSLQHLRVSRNQIF